MQPRTAEKLVNLYHKVPAPILKCVRPIARACRPLFHRLEERHVLTVEQKRFWDENGYLVLEGFYSGEEIDEFNTFYEKLWAERAEHSEWPFVLLAYIGTPHEQKAYLHSAEPQMRALNYKLLDLYLDNKYVRQFIMKRTMVHMLRELLDDQPVLCNTLNFEWGSEQATHIDTFFMTPGSENGLAATWIALENVSNDCGPLCYVPGSHKIPPYVFKSTGGWNATPDELPTAQEYLRDEMQKRGLTEKVFTCSAGDVFIWHARLAHGGSPVTDKSKTRKSLVSHFWTATDLADCPVTGLLSDVDGQVYLNRPHQSVP